MKKSDINQLFSVRAASWLTLVLLFSLPLVHGPEHGTYNAVRYFFFATISIFLLLTTAWTWLRIKWIPKILFSSWYFYGIFVYLLIFLLASLFSVDRVASFWSSFQRTDGFFTHLFLTVFALNIFTLIKIKGKQYLELLLSSSVMGATVLSVLIILFTYRSAGTWFEGAEGGATIGNTSFAASYVLWNIFFGILLIIKAQGSRRIIWGLFTLTMVMSPLFINWSGNFSQGLMSFVGAARGAMIGIIFGVIITAITWLILQENKKQKYLGIILMTVGIAGTVFGFMRLLDPTSSLHQEFGKVARETRFIFWDIAQIAFQERPLLGWGPSTYNIPFHKFFDPKMLTISGGEIWVDKSHNIIFGTLVNGGILLLFAHSFYLASIIYSINKSKKLNIITPWQTSLFIGAFAGWLVQSLFIFDLISSLAMLYLVAGSMYAIASGTVDENVKKDLSTHFPNKLIYGAVVLGSLLLFVYTVVLPYQKNRLMYSTDDTPLPARTALWPKLKEGSPMGRGYDSVLLFRNVYVSYSTNAENLRTGDRALREAAVDELEAIGKYLFDVVKTKKNNAELALLAANFHSLQMSIANNFTGPVMDRALELSNLVVKMLPTNPQAYWIAANIQSIARNTEETKKLLEQAVELEPTLTETHRLILQLAKKTQDNEYYETSLARAKQHIPNFQE